MVKVPGQSEEVRLAHLADKRWSLLTELEGRDPEGTLMLCQRWEAATDAEPELYAPLARVAQLRHLAVCAPPDSERRIELVIAHRAARRALWPAHRGDPPWHKPATASEPQTSAPSSSPPPREA